MLFADLVTADECPASNYGEFFYGKAPDPSGAAGHRLLGGERAQRRTDHHRTRIHARHPDRPARSNYPPATAFQSTWELEGQATFAEEVNGYAATGLAPGQNLGFEIAFNNPATQPITWFVDPFVDLAVYYGFQSPTLTRVSALPSNAAGSERSRRATTVRA